MSCIHVGAIGSSVAGGLNAIDRGQQLYFPRLLDTEIDTMCCHAAQGASGSTVTADVANLRGVYEQTPTRFYLKIS